MSLDIYYKHFSPLFKRENTLMPAELQRISGTESVSYYLAHFTSEIA